jgi:hypothetical protein
MQRVPVNLWSSLGRHATYKTEILHQIEASPLQSLDTINGIKIIFPINGILKEKTGYLQNRYAESLSLKCVLLRVPCRTARFCVV